MFEYSLKKIAVGFIVFNQKVNSVTVFLFYFLLYVKFFRPKNFRRPSGGDFRKSVNNKYEIS